MVIKYFSKIFARGMWYCPFGKGHVRRGGREHVQPDFVHFVSIFLVGVFGRLMTVLMVS
jgi:hypothetical protein